MGITGSNTKELTFSFFPRLNFSIGYKNFVTIPDSSRPDVKVHIARQHINIFFHAVTSLTGCITESVLVMFDVFPNVNSAIYDILENIQKSFLTVNALVVFPTIPDLAEACELSIKYA